MVCEEHHAETRHDHVEAWRFEHVVLCVCADESGCRARLLATRARHVDHRRRDVDAGALRCRTKLRRERERRRTGAATDVEDIARTARDGTFDEARLERLEHRVERGLPVDPGASGAAVPEGGLSRVRMPCFIDSVHELASYGGKPHSAT